MPVCGSDTQTRRHPIALSVPASGDARAAKALVDGHATHSLAVAALQRQPDGLGGGARGRHHDARHGHQARHQVGTQLAKRNKAEGGTQERDS